ncbi:MAG: carboxypeptidase-like regulatory domain-containing protein [Halarsenatibacteraceae bacterium]
MKRLKIFGILSLLIIFVFVVAACDNATTTTDDIEAAASTYTVTVNVTPADAMVELNGMQKQAVDGVAVFENVEEGPYTLIVSADGYQSQTLETNVNDELSVEVELQANNGDSNNDNNDEEDEEEITQPLAPAMDANDAATFAKALNNKAETIVLQDDIILERRVRVNYHLVELDLNGNTIYLEGGPLVFQGDDTLVHGGTIVGDVDYEEWETQSSGKSQNVMWWPQEDLEFSNSVLMDGAGIMFDDMIFNVPVFDWFQNQAMPASGLTIENSTFNDYGVFVSDVTILDSDVFDRLGVDHDDALLERLTVHGPKDVTDEDGAKGILYIASNATLNDITWEGNFAGMYVGKSLKYAVLNDDKENRTGKAYVKAEPVLTDAVINNNKDGMAWWAINYDKAILTVNGLVEVNSEEGRNGLTLVGTDYRDYGEYQGSYDGGHIYGDATFVGSDVHFGWHTGDYLEVESNGVGVSYWVDIDYGSYNEISRIFGTKSKFVPDEVDDQAAKKNADRLTIHGLTFDAEVQIFTPANEYISNPCNKEEGAPSTRCNCAPLADDVWLGNIEFNNVVHLWGDFSIIDGKTVINNDQIRLRSGNIRRIGAETTFTSILSDCTSCPDNDLDIDECKHDYEFIKRGRLLGGEIVSDTKNQNVLVLGDNLLVEDVELSKYLYNVILETTKLLDVDIFVGDRQQGQERYVLGIDLEDADVHVWPDNTPILEDVMWSSKTKLEVWIGSGITFAGNIDNFGDIRFQLKTSIFFDDPVVFDQDIREDNEVIITDLTQRAEIEAFYAKKDRWYFEDWKFDFMLTAQDDLFESTWYELKLGDSTGYEYTFLLDLRDLDAAGVSLSNGMLLSDLLASDAVIYADGSFARERFSGDPAGNKFSEYFKEKDFKARLTAVYPDGYYDTDGVWKFNDKTFDLKVDAWGINCCDVPRILFASDEENINLVHKITELLKVEEDEQGNKYMIVKNEGNIIIIDKIEF